MSLASTIAILFWHDKAIVCTWSRWRRVGYPQTRSASSRGHRDRRLCRRPDALPFYGAVAGQTIEIGHPNGCQLLKKLGTTIRRARCFEGYRRLCPSIAGITRSTYPGSNSELPSCSRPLYATCRRVFSLQHSGLTLQVDSFSKTGPHCILPASGGHTVMNAYLQKIDRVTRRSEDLQDLLTAARQYEGLAALI